MLEVVQERYEWLGWVLHTTYLGKKVIMYRPGYFYNYYITIYKNGKVKQGKHEL